MPATHGLAVWPLAQACRPGCAAAAARPSQSLLVPATPRPSSIAAFGCIQWRQSQRSLQTTSCWTTWTAVIPAPGHTQCYLFYSQAGRQASRTQHYTRACSSAAVMPDRRSSCYITQPHFHASHALHKISQEPAGLASAARRARTVPRKACVGGLARSRMRWVTIVSSSAAWELESSVGVASGGAAGLGLAAGRGAGLACAQNPSCSDPRH